MIHQKAILTPTSRQAEWADCEIGVIIHLDLQVFDPLYKEHYGEGDRGGLALFSPDSLNTDQWIETAVRAGATYALLTAKHGTGFTLFPSTANDFSIANTPYLNGKGDVVADFIASCKKYNVKPGLYYNTSYNWYYGIQGGLPKAGTRTTLEEYNRIVLQQLEELWSRYGELFEIWFDGGCLPPEQGGPDLLPLLYKYQGNAITFQSPPTVENGIRWVGNERATANFDCWATVDRSRDAFDGVTELDRGGNPYGEMWRAAEADTPGREAHRSYEGGWIWREGEEHTVIPAEVLFERYLTSVGRNCNFLIGMAIDRHGLCPAPDAEALSGLGMRIQQAFGRPLTQYRGDLHASTYHLAVPNGGRARYLVIMEDITKGERILHYQVNCGIEGHSIGHKRIIALPPDTREVTFTILESKDTPALRGLWLYG